MAYERQNFEDGNPLYASQLQKIEDAIIEAQNMTIEETDPTVPAWAKESQKPTYTAQEVGALPNTYTPPEAPVKSVNGYTGTVSLSAEDVGALPDTYVPPAAPVQSVNGKTGEITLVPDDIGALANTGGTVDGKLLVTKSAIINGDLTVNNDVTMGGNIYLTPGLNLFDSIDDLPSDIPEGTLMFVREES